MIRGLENFKEPGEGVCFERVPMTPNECFYSSFYDVPSICSLLLGDG